MLPTCREPETREAESRDNEGARECSGLSGTQHPDSASSQQRRRNKRRQSPVTRNVACRSEFSSPSLLMECATTNRRQAAVASGWRLSLLRLCSSFRSSAHSAVTLPYPLLLAAAAPSHSLECFRCLAVDCLPLSLSVDASVRAAWLSRHVTASLNRSHGQPRH